MSRLKSYVAIVALILEACSSSHERIIPWSDNLSVEQNIAKNVIVLENDDDLSFLDDIVLNRSVVLLGEETHADYSSSIVKLKIIDYLQNKGFHSLAYEGQDFLMSYVLSNPQYAELTKKWKTSPLVWSTEVLIRDNRNFSIIS